MSKIFSEPIQTLPQADVPLPGVTAYLSQAATHQIVFMEFAEDAVLPEHHHESQAGFVLEGRIDLCIGGKTLTYRKGGRYFIPAGVKHSGKIYAGYADITFFNEPRRYQIKPKNLG